MQTGDGTIVNAVRAAIRDLRQPSVSPVTAVPDEMRIDGKCCLVTGANSGLGRAAAVDLACRGGHVILACRPGHPETRGEIMKRSGSGKVEMMEVDLADLVSVHRFCDRLANQGIRIDIAVLNAGLMPRRARKTPQGYEVMFAVHFLANRVMIDRWLRDGVIRPTDCEVPRIVFISSEAHRSTHAIDFERFGAFRDYGMRNGLKYYGLSKLIQCTFATELSRRLIRDGRIEVAVHALCPGGMYTNIFREAPTLLKPVLNALFRRFFQSPEESVAPVAYLCCAEESGSSSGMYLHLMQRKSVSPMAADPENGRKLWDASEILVARSRDTC